MKYHFLVAAIAIATTFSSCAEAQQRADNDFDATVSVPSFTSDGPRVLFDEGHNNFHTTEGRYQPFAQLITNDGYKVRPLKEQVTAAALQQTAIFIIANALGEGDENTDPAFSETECETIKQWVHDGGALLLIADHFPFGSAVQNLGDRFGINFQKGMVADSIRFDTASQDQSQLEFSMQNGLLAQHEITADVERVITFTGQSLSCSQPHTSLLKLSPSAFDLQPQTKVVKDGGDTRVEVSYDNPSSAAGRSQGIAMIAGKGKVIVLGEAAMLTAQKNRHGAKMGMNYNPGNKKFALNIMHWLAEKQ